MTAVTPLLRSAAVRDSTTSGWTWTTMLLKRCYEDVSDVSTVVVGKTEVKRVLPGGQGARNPPPKTASRREPRGPVVSPDAAFLGCRHRGRRCLSL